MHEHQTPTRIRERVKLGQRAARCACDLEPLRRLEKRGRHATQLARGNSRREGLDHETPAVVGTEEHELWQAASFPVGGTLQRHRQHQSLALEGLAETR